MSDQEATLDEFIEESDGTGRKSVRWGPKKKTIPSDWDFDPIIDHADEIIYPQRDKPTRFDGNIPWVRIEDLDGIYISEPRDGKRYVSRELMNEMNLRSFPEGTLMCSCSTTMGVCAITAREMLSNQTFAGIVSKDSINTHYLYYAITNGAEELEQVATGSTISYLSSDKLEAFHIPRPSLPEQRKIATVLYTVDQAIEKTMEIIKQSLEVKNGVVQELLTEGIRDYSEYENYRLGPIDLTKPKEWKLRPFGEFAFRVQDGPHITPDYVDEGIPFVSSQNVNPFGEEFDYSQYEKYISEETYEGINQNCRPEKGDLIISRRATIGPTQLIRHNTKFGFFVGVAVIKTDDTVYNPFLEQLMNWSAINKLWHLKSPGSTMKTLNLGTIKEQKIPLPPIEEQKEIASILRSIDEDIITNKQYKKSLQRLKQGLQQDLLSGTVRTTNTTIEVPDEVTQHG